MYACIQIDMAELRWIPNGWQLHIERMSERVLLSEHLKYLNEVMKFDLFKDHSDCYESKMLEALGNELRIRRSAHE